MIVWTLTTMAQDTGLMTTVHESEEAAQDALAINFGPEPFDPTLLWEIESHDLPEEAS